MKKVILFKEKNAYHREAVGYISVPVKRGACGRVEMVSRWWGDLDIPDYEGIDTFLTKEEWEKLVTPVPELANQQDTQFNELLTSIRQRDFQYDVVNGDKSTIMQELDLSEEDYYSIVSSGYAQLNGFDFDASAIDRVFDGIEDMGRSMFVDMEGESIPSLFMEGESIPSLLKYPFIANHIDFKGIAQDILGDEKNKYRFLQLPSGRIVEFVI